MRRNTAVAATVFALLLAGCSPSTTSPSATPRPVDGGTVTVGVWQEPSTLLDAGVTGHVPFADVMAAPVQEGLLWYRSSGETANTSSAAEYWAPDLATEVPTPQNGDVRTSGCPDAHAAMCVTWKLRQGVQWDDGSAFTSHDVCDTYRLFWLDYGAQQRANPTPVDATAGWDQVTGCSETDRYTATLDFKSQYGPYLSLGSGVYGILPATLADQALSHDSALGSVTVPLDLRSGSGNAAAFNGQAPVDHLLDGTGPFVLQSYVAGSQLVLVPNKHYWDAQHRPHLDKLVFKIEAGLPAEVTDTISGAVTIGLDLRLPILPTLSGRSHGASASLSLETIPASGAEKIDFNLCAAHAGICGSGAAQNPYTADAAIRKAVLQGIDRDSIANTVTQGHASTPKDSWMYLGATYLDDASIPATKYDPNAANGTLDAAGYARDAKCGTAPDGKSYRHWKDGSCIVIKIATSNDDSARLNEEKMVQAGMQRLGINVPGDFSGNATSATLFATYADGGELTTHAFDAAVYAVALQTPGEPDGLVAQYHGDCGGSCPGELQIPSPLDGGAGMNVTGVSDPQLDQALDHAQTTVDPTQRRNDYVQAEQRLAALLPEIPLFQQLIVVAYSSALHGVLGNDIVWDYNIADWYCSATSTGRGDCSRR